MGFFLFESENQETNALENCLKVKLVDYTKPLKKKKSTAHHQRLSSSRSHPQTQTINIQHAPSFLPQSDRLQNKDKVRHTQNRIYPKSKRTD